LEAALRAMLEPLRAWARAEIASELRRIEEARAPSAPPAGAIRQELEGLSGAPVRWGACPAPAHKPSVVLVAGLLPGQFALLRMTTSPVALQLRHVGSDMTTRHARKLAQGADHVVLMTKFISHRLQDALRVGGPKIHYCNGGVTEVQELVADIGNVTTGEKR
jgi:hypothetical protein